LTDNTFFASHVINGRPRHVDTDEKKKVVIRYASIEAFLVLLLSFFVNTCVVITFASFYGQDGSEDAGISSAGALLAAQSGRLVEMLFAIGLLSSGLVATLCLTYAGQVVMCGLLEIKVDAAWRLLATRLIALIPCLSLAVVFEATNTFDQVAQTINIIQSLVLPFGLIPVIHMSASKNIMGAWASKQWVLWGAATITLGIVGINVFTLVTLLMELPAFSSEGPEFIGSCVGFAFLILFYLSLVAYFSVGPPRWPCIISRIKSRVYGALNMAHRRFDPESMLEA
jgi:Mn2+/Fe2+ NRAMP family transporter